MVSTRLVKEKPISAPEKILRRKSAMTSLARKEFLPFEAGNKFSLKVIILQSFVWSWSDLFPA
jgi:hypothetical protein